MSIKEYVCTKCFKSIDYCRCKKSADFLMYVPEQLQQVNMYLNKKGYHVVSCKMDTSVEIQFESPYFALGTISLPRGFNYSYAEKRILSDERINQSMLNALLVWAKSLPKFVPVKYNKSLVFDRRYNNTAINKNFGEYLIMFQLMAYRGWDVENVDYVGADLIAIDTNATPKKRYAIQVKMRHFVTDGESNQSFTFDSEDKLRKFANSMSTEHDKMIPIVAFVNVNHDQSINTFLINLDDLSEMRRNDEIGEVAKKHHSGIYYPYGYSCNSKTHLYELMANPKVTCYRYRPEFVNRPLDREIVDEKLDYIEEYALRFRAKKPSEEHDKIQKGTFGEWYYMIKSVASGMHPFLIQSIGADILEVDPNHKDNTCAISVKTFSKKEDDSYNFEKSNADKLIAFCNKWGLQRKRVALQFLIYREKKDTDGKNVNEYYLMYNFTMDLDYLMNTENAYIKPSKSKETGEINGYTINWAYDKKSGIDRLKCILEDDNIAVDIVMFNEPLLYEELNKKIQLREK